MPLPGLGGLAETLLFVWIGGSFVWHGVKSARRVRVAQRTWQTVPGQITAGRMGGHWSRTTNDYSHPIYINKAQLTYTYRVGGQEYTGHTVTINDVGTSWHGPQRKLL